ncbi:unknown [Lachnospiraceae bacterium CAG:215]|nr:unknown [Lachnospiraceae bacterium CAG:215]
MYSCISRIFRSGAVSIRQGNWSGNRRCALSGARLRFEQKRTWTLLFRFFRLFWLRQRNLRNQFLIQKSAVDCLKHGIIHCLLFLKAKFHLGWMDVDVHSLSVHKKMQDKKRKFVLHHKIFIGVFRRFGNNGALHIAPVYKYIFKISVAACDDRFPDKAADADPVFLIIQFQYICRSFSSVNAVNHFF